MRLHEAAKALALERGTRCPSCDRQGSWSQEVSAVVCETCWDGDVARVISRRWVPRAAVCGEKSISGTGGVKLRLTGRRRDGTVRAGFDGVYYCNKPWQCPRCARRSAFHDARTLHACNMGWRGYYWDAEAERWRRAHGATSHHAYLLSATLPHRRGQALEPMRRAVTTAFSKCHVGASWAGGGKKQKGGRTRRKIGAKQRYGIRAMVRALEVNHGSSGWHPHIHAVLLTERKLTAAEIERLRLWYWARWSKTITAAGYSRPSSTRVGVDLIEADKAGRYLAKMGLAELAGDRAKLGRCPACNEYRGTEWRELRRRCVECGHEVNRTMWQVLEDLAEHGAEHDRRLWRRWCAEIRGARRLTWSRDKVADEQTVRELYSEYIRVPESAACACRGLDPECKKKWVDKNGKKRVGCVGSGPREKRQPGDGVADRMGRYTRHRLKRKPRQADLELEKIEVLNIPPEVWRYMARSADLRVALKEAYELGDKHAIEALYGQWMKPAVLPHDPDDEAPVTPSDDVVMGKAPHAGLVLSLEELAELREARATN